MTGGRLFIDPVLERIGSRSVAVALTIMAMTGALLTGFAPNYPIAMIGLGFLGLGCSALYPIAVSAAAQRTDRSAAVNVAALAQMSFVIFFLGPPVLGFVAQLVGIKASYLVCVPFAVMTLFACRSLPGRALGVPSDANAKKVPS